jgi:muramoyltetrapeptide carboxypeptidase
MDIPIITPRALSLGDTIGIVAPAGTVDQRGAFELGLSSLERLGFRVRYDERIFESYRYLAGSDSARAEELTRYVEDPEIHAIIALRGGYGCSRLIPILDEKRLRRHCKLFMGFSDLTTLHLYFRRRLGWITIHGPMAASATLGNLSADQEAHLKALLMQPDYLPSLSIPTMECWNPGVAEGQLSGGCLSLITASLGTPYEIKTEGKILFLEDLGEAPYRIDRMLTQLKLAGKLDSLSGILLGDFTNCEPEEGGYTAQDVLKELLGFLQIPILSGFPSGHGDANWAIPFGVKVRLDANSCAIQFLEPAVSAA